MTALASDLCTCLCSRALGGRRSSTPFAAMGRDAPEPKTPSRKEGPAGSRVRKAMGEVKMMKAMVKVKVKAKAKAKAQGKAKAKAKSKAKAKASAKLKARRMEKSEPSRGSTVACSVQDNGAPRKRGRPKKEAGVNILDAMQGPMAQGIRRLGKVQLKFLMDESEMRWPEGFQHPNWAASMVNVVYEKMVGMPAQKIIINTWSDCVAPPAATCCCGLPSISKHRPMNGEQPTCNVV